MRAPARTDSADPRAARVRDGLRRAAFELIERRRVEKISVSDITQRAGVSRQVFYQHFRDRDDAVSSAVAASLQAAAAETVGEQPVALIHRLCDYTAEHAGLYRNLYPSAASQQTADAYRDLIRPACEQLAAGLAKRPADALADFLIGGIIEVSRQQDEHADTAARANDLRARIDTCLEAVGVQVS
ncbi:TetR family transcriptional regulator [Amycolatopsis sp. H6(2020)]|nr:TetR family transcriptional regulator [Amycolatopsis sp. H6(2020)]